jgi:hypothetical protein
VGRDVGGVGTAGEGGGVGTQMTGCVESIAISPRSLSNRVAVICT